MDNIIIEHRTNSKRIEIVKRSGAPTGGVSLDISAKAGMNLSGGRVVAVIAGLVYYFDPQDIEMFGMAVGITKTSALLNDFVDIKTFGKFYESGLNLEPDNTYFAGLNGTLTLNPENLLICQEIGRSLDSDSILLNIKTSIETI